IMRGARATWRTAPGTAGGSPATARYTGTWGRGADGGAAVKYYLASTRCPRCYSVQPVHWSEAAVRAARSLPPGAVFANLPCRRTRCIDPQTGRRTIVEVVTEDFAKVTPV